MRDNKAIIIAGTQSGSGKTTVTLGLMAALSKAGYKVDPFKCGPDFIDPSLHKLVTGKNSINLDIWMSGERFTQYTFDNHNKEGIAVIEGVMGMFDGGTSSSAALAKSLNVPLVLVLDVRSAAESVAAVLKGFEILDPDVALRGVILNRIGSERHLELVRGAVEKHCKAEILGYLPRALDFDIPSRHLGLHMGQDSPISTEAIDKLADTVATHIDLKKLMGLAERAPLATLAPEVTKIDQTVRIGVARDRAFCFYYEDNLDLLRAAGAEIVTFSPLKDKALPEGLHGVYLGGGYPELYAQKLSENTSMQSSIKSWADAGGVIYAECGGFMYLTQGIVTLEKDQYPMAGVFPVMAKMQKKRASLGYREVSLKSDCFLGREGVILRGHEFHYSSIDEMPESIDRVYEVNSGTSEGYRHKNVLGGYMHLHFGYHPAMAEEFVKFCKG
jgi:cobyrinic acid a,c-diamide synthase